MRHYPVFLNLRDREVLIVGGGEIAWQKIQGLRESEARVRVVSPEAIDPIRDAARRGTLRWEARKYAPSDLWTASLVISATDDKALQKQIAAQARKKKIWVNVVDVPSLCDFIAPAIVTRGDIQIAISTGGVAPALAKFLRKKLEPVLGDEYVAFTQLLRTWRKEILKLPKAERDRLWECIVSEPFLQQIKQEGLKAAEAHLKEWIHGKRSL